MTVGVTSPVAEMDPVRAALDDPKVRDQLVAHARACLSGRLFYLPAPQRGPEADEIVQKAALRVWEHRAEYDPSRPVVPWLIKFVTYVTREHVKNYARRATGPPSAPLELEELAEDLGRPAGDAVADKTFVDGLLSRLSAADREIVRLKYDEALSFAEIGPRVGLLENAARQRHYRILAELRKLAGGTGEVQS
jgi:RNA polymerase sigma-70 factor (ECF subfamily)